MSYFILNKLLYSEISIIGIIFTGILLKKSIPKEGYRFISRQQKVFVAMLINLIAIFCLDGITWCLDGLSFYGIKTLYSICLAVYFMINPLIGFLWNLYVTTKIYTNIRVMKKYMRICTVPFVINVILCATSPFTHWIYSINENGIYSRGMLYPVNIILSYIYYVTSVLILIRYMSKDERMRTNRELKYLMLFPVAPLVGSILQNLFYGISVVYISVLISFLIIFINVQNAQIYTDAGTGLKNKSYLSVYLNEKLMSLKRNHLIGVVLIDLDYFKNLNDTYGHTAGDEALKDVAHILNQTFDTNVDCLSRFGGDEFVVILIRNSEEEIQQEIKRLKENVNKFNLEKSREYKLHFSVGYGIGRGNENIEEITLDRLLKTADVKMYEDKKANHENTVY